MDVTVKFIKKLGVHNIGDEIVVHENMAKHLKKIGVVYDENANISVSLNKQQPVILKAAEPVNMTAKPKKAKSK